MKRTQDLADYSDSLKQKVYGNMEM